MFKRTPFLLAVIRTVLLVEAGAAALGESWPEVFIALATLGLTFLPGRVARLMGVRLPPSFLTFMALFIFGTIFLGEIEDFYERFWWWDIVLHFGSALSFGIFGFLLIFMLFEGDRYAAPPWAIGFLSFCLAVSVGAVWEIFEFVMDQSFGLNMQKSGLVDTMWDLIVDTAGAAIGALAGFLYLLDWKVSGLGGAIDEFVGQNKRLYRRIRRR